MQKINFQDYPNTATPLNAQNLNQMQTNIEKETLKKGAMMKVSLNNNFNIPQGAVTKILWDKVVENNFNNDYANNFSLTNGNIKINSDLIKCVVVTGCIQSQGCTNTYLYIDKGSTRYVAHESNWVGNNCVAIIPVQKNDLISVHTHFSTAGVVTNWTAGSFVEIVAL